MFICINNVSVPKKASVTLDCRAQSRRHLFQPQKITQKQSVFFLTHLKLKFQTLTT